MKKPEMEIVKFHNEDVIATSGQWSGQVNMYLSNTSTTWSTSIPIVRGQTSEGNDVWMNSVAWNSFDPSGVNETPTESKVYGDTNTLGGVIVTIEQIKLQEYITDGTEMHYRLDSQIGPWPNVYTVWEICGGNGCSHCYN